MAVSTSQLIAGLYTSFFSRAPDQGGLSFWGNAAQQSGLSDVALSRAMAKGFANHPYFTNIYGSLDNAGFIDAIYINVGGAPADAAGKADWLGKLNNGSLTRADFVADFTFGLLNITLAQLQSLRDSGSITPAEYDSALLRQNRLTNKTDVALKYVAALGANSNLSSGTDAANPISLANDPAFHASQAIIAGVDQNAASKNAPTNYLNTSPTVTGINATFGANIVTVVMAAGATGTNYADTFQVDVASALTDGSGSNFQPTITNFSAGDVLRIDLPISNTAIKNLAQLNGQQGVAVQVNPFEGSVLINFGNDSNGGEVVVLTLVGVTDPTTVAVQVV